MRAIYPRIITFRAPEEVNDLLERLAKELRVSKSEAIRRAIVRYAQELGLWEDKNIRYAYVSEPGRGRGKVYKDVDLVIV